MFKWVAIAIVIAVPSLSLAAEIDIKKITCQELFFDQPPDRKSFVIAVNLQWLSGYYHRDAELSTIDMDKANQLAVNLGKYCGLHRKEKIFDVYGRLFREIHQGKRASR